MSRATKGARVVRLARLLRLVRVVKLFRLRARRVEDDDDDDVEQQPSKVAKRLTELATRKIVILLLLMVAVFPLFDDPLGATGASSDGSYRRLGVQTLHALRPTLPEDTTASDYCLSEMDEFCSNLRTYVSKMGKVRYLRVDGHDYDEYLKSIYFHRQGKGWFQGVKSTYSKSGGPRGKDSLGFPVHEGQGRMESDKRPLGKKRKACSIAPCSNEGAWDPREDLVDSLADLKDLYGWRIGEGKDLDWSVVQEGDCVHPRECIQTGTVVFYDTRDAAKFDALLNLLRMVVVMVVLTTAVVVYTQDATVLVVGPIERMMSLVRRLAENPLGNMSQRKRNSQKHIDQTDETFLLDQTLTKISGLLQVGFGAAGAEVIARSMDTSLQNQTYVLPGKRVTAVFGFAIVEDFTVTCGALEEDTITYVNTVASIVHAGAAAFHGAPNKNIGCAFLLVWKICDGTLPGLRDLRDKDPPPNTPEFRQWRTARRAATSVASRAQDDIASRPVPPLEMVESALAAFLKVQVDLRAANADGGRLSHFCNDPRVKKALGDDFKVKMGFGLHVGWAIEGTIGSKFKIDASYLSPNVNVSARLEAATHMYDCPLLFSGFFADELSPAARSFCRMVDVVSVKGSNVPLELWTFDISTYPGSSPAPFTTVLNGHKVPKAVDFAGDLYYRDLQRDISPDFMSRFNDGIQDYVAGDWLSSKKNLSDALKIMPADGPTKTLYRVLKSYDFRAPADWRGYRALTSKT
jgi:class 3 adenylate cyclase